MIKRHTNLRILYFTLLCFQKELPTNGKTVQTRICWKGTSNTNVSLKYGLSDDFRTPEVFFFICFPLTDNATLTAESARILTTARGKRKHQNILFFRGT